MLQLHRSFQHKVVIDSLSRVTPELFIEICVEGANIVFMY